MAKMRIAGSRIVDVGELLVEIEEELKNRDSFNLDNPYEKGMHDELRWIRNRLRSLKEVEPASAYENAFGRKP